MCGPIYNPWMLTQAAWPKDIASTNQPRHELLPASATFTFFRMQVERARQVISQGRQNELKIVFESMDRNGDGLVDRKVSSPCMDSRRDALHNGCPD